MVKLSRPEGALTIETLIPLVLLSHKESVPIYFASKKFGMHGNDVRIMNKAQIVTLNDYYIGLSFNGESNEPGYNIRSLEDANVLGFNNYNDWFCFADKELAEQYISR